MQIFLTGSLGELGPSDCSEGLPQLLNSEPLGVRGRLRLLARVTLGPWGQPGVWAEEYTVLAWFKRLEVLERLTRRPDIVPAGQKSFVALTRCELAGRLATEACEDSGSALLAPCPLLARFLRTCSLCLPNTSLLPLLLLGPGIFKLENRHPIPQKARDGEEGKTPRTTPRPEDP